MNASEERRAAAQGAAGHQLLAAFEPSQNSTIIPGLSSLSHSINVRNGSHSDHPGLSLIGGTGTPSTPAGQSSRSMNGSQPSHYYDSPSTPSLCSPATPKLSPMAKEFRTKAKESDKDQIWNMNRDSSSHQQSPIRRSFHLPPSPPITPSYFSLKNQVEYPTYLPPLRYVADAYPSPQIAAHSPSPSHQTLMGYGHDPIWKPQMTQGHPNFSSVSTPFFVPSNPPRSPAVKVEASPQHQPQPQPQIQLLQLESSPQPQLIDSTTFQPFKTKAQNTVNVKGSGVIYVNTTGNRLNGNPSRKEVRKHLEDMKRAGLKK